MTEKLGVWFDPYNMDHIAAYLHLQDNGRWPVGFLPNDVTCENLWQITIANKLADAWVKHMVENFRECPLGYKEGEYPMCNFSLCGYQSVFGCGYKGERL